MTGSPAARRAARRADTRSNPAFCRARTCYDHLAGKLGVALTEALVAQGYLRPEGRAFALSAAGARFLEGWGVDVAAARGRKRAFARQCLDWSERRPHLGGALGAALAAQCLARGWVRRAEAGRGLVVTAAGHAALAREFDVVLDPAAEARQ